MLVGGVTGYEGLCQLPVKAQYAMSTLIDTLRREARRLAVIGAVESAAVGATAGGVCSIAIESAWILARFHTAAAVGISLLPALLAAALGARSVRKVASVTVRQAAIMACLCVLSAIAAAAIILAGWEVSVPVVVPPAALLAAGAAALGCEQLIRGVSLPEAAFRLDVRFGLEERLSTAVELAEKDADVDLREYLDVQGLDALRGCPRRPRMWTRTRRTSATLGMVVLLCATLAAVASQRGGEGAADVLRIAQAFDTMSPPRRAVLATELRRLGGGDDLTAELAEAVNEAAVAAEHSDPTTFRQAINNVNRLVMAGSDGVSGQFAEELILAAGVDGGADDKTPMAERLGTRELHPPPTGDDAKRFGELEDSALHSRGYVRVYDPHYDESSGTTDERTVAGTVDPESSVQYDAAWMAARNRAADALARGRIEGRYRRLVRDYFLTE